MQKIIISSFIFLSFCSLAHAQGTVEMDAIAFVRDSGKVQVEIYYSILQGALEFENKGSTWVAPIHARAEIWQDGQAIAAQDINKEKIFTGTEAALKDSKGSLILDGVALKAGLRSTGEAVLIFRSKNSKGADVFDTIDRKFFVPHATADKFFLSGIEFAGNLTPSSDRTNPFEKVGYIITPNPSKVFGATNSKLNYYTELYIPKSAVSSSESCEIITHVFDGQKHEMFSNSHRQYLAGSTIPLIGSIDIDGLPTDSYVLEIIVKRGENIEASMQKLFFYDSGMKLSEDEDDAPSKALVDEELVFASSDISKMTELELQEKGDQAMYLGNNEQVKAWKKLKKQMEYDQQITVGPTDSAKVNAANQREKDAVSQRRFLFQFWRAKDKQLGSKVELQAYHDYYKHVDEVNKKFTYQKTAGWKTDFGRVYLTYGAADERNITSELHNIGAKPYIIWKYYDKNLRLLSGSTAQFVFVDKQGGGKFVLVHSNVQGEVYEPDWYSQEAQRTN